MRKRSLHYAPLALLLAALGLAPAVLAAGDDKSGSKPAAAVATGKGQGGTKYSETCAAGNAKYLAHDYTGAADKYKSAAQMSPKNPLAFYLLGEAQLAAANMAEAEGAWKQAEQLSDSKDPSLRAKVLFVLADLKERQKKWDDAKAAWQAYSDWAAKNPQAQAFPASATARIQAIDAAMKQDKDYEIVRQRIRDSADGGVLTDPNAPSPAAK